MATFDALQGGPGTVMNCVNELRKRNLRTGYNPVYSITNVMNYIKAGHNVTGASGQLLQNAGYDGATIGAGQYV